MSEREGQPAGDAGGPARTIRRRAVLFDLDGTLLESRLSIRDTLNRVLAENRLQPFTRADMDRLIGTPLRGILAERTGDAALIEAMAHRYRAAYNETGWVTVTIFPGLLDIIHGLRRRGVLVATVTSKGQQETETLFADLGITDLFDCVVGDDDVRPLKPDPAPVVAACEKLGVPPEAAVMVGDTTFDIHSARAAGAYAVGVLWGIHDRATLQAAEADATVADAPALAKLLTRLLR